MTTYIVYQAVNLTNGHRYVGVTSLSLIKRMQLHRSAAKSEKIRKNLFQMAILEFGIEAFIFSEIEKIEGREEAGLAEIRAIYELKSQYNEARGGWGGGWWAGKARDEKTKEKIRSKKLGVARPAISESIMDIYRDNMRRSAAAKRKRVISYPEMKLFDSVTEAAKAYGLSKTTVSAICKGRRKQAYGRSFSFEICACQ